MKSHDPKLRSGRGRERIKWVFILYPMIVGELDHLCKAGVRLDYRLLRQLSPDAISKSTHTDCKKANINEKSGIVVKEQV